MKRLLAMVLFLLLPWHAQGQCRRGNCGSSPESVVPPAFLFGWEKTVCVCTPSRRELFNRMIEKQKQGNSPDRVLDLFTSDEKFDLKRNMLHGSDRQKAFLTWMIVSNGTSLPEMVKRKLPAQQVYLIEQQLEMYHTQVQRQQELVRRQQDAALQKSQQK